MNKETIELARFEKEVKGYDWVLTPNSISKNAVLNAIVEWSKGKNITIYAHNLRRGDENEDKYNKKYYGYTFKIPGGIPYCDWVYYLDIWYQDK